MAKNLDPLELFLWTFRRNEKDVINLYDYTSDMMRLATGGDMLNFGYWHNTDSPLQAQDNLCSVFGKMAQLEPTQKIIDVGSGYGAPAIHWKKEFGIADITCVNINAHQLQEADSDNISQLNATATHLPFGNSTVDRVLAFESAQHFKPLRDFVSESYRILKDDGVLALAIPVMMNDSGFSSAKLGVLSMTWSSEHYTLDTVLDTLQEKFKITAQKEIGASVYEPLANYYNTNRNTIREKIKGQYPSYVEKILHISINKMKAVSEAKVIGYLLITCQK